MALGAGYVPDYPGADRYRTRGAVLPVFTYRGPVLRIDGGSIRGRLARTSDWELDLSATGAFNARSPTSAEGPRPSDPASAAPTITISASGEASSRRCGAMP